MSEMEISLPTLVQVRVGGPVNSAISLWNKYAYARKEVEGRAAQV